jgi:hypothetical protein
VFDHPLWFRSREGRRSCNVAMVGQPYGHDGPRQRAEQLARELGLQLQVPPAGAFASIWYPGCTLFLVFTLPSVVVRWLPEQQTGSEWMVRR